jgi:hypothetical protein
MIIRMGPLFIGYKWKKYIIISQISFYVYPESKRKPEHPIYIYIYTRTRAHKKCLNFSKKAFYSIQGIHQDNFILFIWVKTEDSYMNDHLINS